MAVSPSWTANGLRPNPDNAGGVVPNQAYQAALLPGFGGGPPFPFASPPAEGQGAFPAAWASQQWNRHWEAGAGAYGWKFDVDKEVPYFPLQYSGARQLMMRGAAPLR